jgi:D-sedoheptulose 7-phosphate isomerase
MAVDVQDHARRGASLRVTFFAENEANLRDAAGRIEAALRAGGKVLVFGNGGSAADAQHVAAELVGRFRRDRAPLAAVALTTDTSVLTSLANDFGYEDVFARQVRALGRKGDVAIAISTSGNSPNVVKGIAAARAAGVTVIGLAGGTGGKMAALCDALLVVPDADTALVQEVHLAAEHLLCDLVDEAFSAKP